jgi:hypothetical protein
MFFLWNFRAERYTPGFLLMVYSDCFCVQFHLPLTFFIPSSCPLSGRRHDQLESARDFGRGP